MRAHTLENLMEILLEHDMLSGKQAKDILVKEKQLMALVKKARERKWGKDSRPSAQLVSPVEVVVQAQMPYEDGVLSEDQIMETLAMATGTPYYKIDPLKLDAKLITGTLSRAFARGNTILPLWKKSGRLTIAVDNPYSMEPVESLRSLTNLDIEVVLSSKSDIMKTIREVYGFRSSVESAVEELTPTIDVGNFEQLMYLRSAEEIEATDAHIVNAVDYLLRYAFEHKASDVHIEPKRNEGTVRMRIDGVLHLVHRIPRSVMPAVISRIKTLARMDIAERRRPQDGRIKTTDKDEEIELRISTMPVAFGEKVVIRIFDPSLLLQDLDSLGFFPTEMAQFKSFIHRPHGVVLVTGPTGSGKTTTLYSVLQSLATDRVNIVTIEDPIEMVVEAFNQVAVQPKAGIDFSSALRTILRQDPDIIMVGEIRDEETANNAMQAALTGHLVFSTLHTNDSAGAITRLRDLGVPPFLIASTVIGVVAQRLVRKVCSACGETTKLTREQCAALQIPVVDGRDVPELSIKVGKGCPVCRQTGMKGRTGIYEVMALTDRVRKLVHADADAVEIIKSSKSDGLTTLREAAIKKLAAGVTPFEEVVRVTSDLP